MVWGSWFRVWGLGFRVQGVLPGSADVVASVSALSPCSPWRSECHLVCQRLRAGERESERQTGRETERTRDRESYFTERELYTVCGKVISHSPRLSECHLVCQRLPPHAGERDVSIQGMVRVTKLLVGSPRLVATLLFVSIGRVCQSKKKPFPRCGANVATSSEPASCGGCLVRDHCRAEKEKNKLFN